MRPIQWYARATEMLELIRLKSKYHVHRFDIKMTRDQRRLEQFLNSLEGEVVAIIPNVTPMLATYVDFLLIVEKKES